MTELEGMWQATRLALETGDVPAEQVRLLRYVFEDNRVRILEGERETGSGAFRLNDDGGLLTIRVTITSGPGAGQTIEGLYRKSGNQLFLCLGTPLPKSFEAKNGATLIELVDVE